MQKPLETATLAWRNANTPVSSQFGDVYFSAEDGFAESRYVYLDNNDLPRRFTDLQQNHFTIAETGFGTGLNFLLAWQCWQQYAPKGKKLYYLSTECFPLTRQDLSASLACWPALAEYSRILCASYPLPIKGLHCLELADNLTLVLLLGDATESLQLLLENNHPLLRYAPERSVDAWFLDGFAPDKNPGMWTRELFTAMARLSKKGSTFASFTAAGMVRRGLQAAGFAVEKTRGFGKKRDMIRGQYMGLPYLEHDTKTSLRQNPYGHFWPIYRRRKNFQSVLVIGAGIAGFTTAKLLASAGMQVQVLDSHDQPLQGASGNPQAMLFPKFSHDSGTFAEFNLLSYLYAQRFYQRYGGDAFHPCGMLQMLKDEDMPNARKILQRFSGLHTLVTLLDGEAASALAKTTLDMPCLWFPGSGWIRPETLRASLHNDPRTSFTGNTRIVALEKNGDGWQASASDGRLFHADAIVLCNAHNACELLPQLHLPAKAIRGQVSLLPAQGYKPLATIICHEGYIAPVDPQHPEHYTFGASYDLHSSDTGLLEESQLHNIHTLQEHLPEFRNFSTGALPLQGRTEFRCTMPDYLPVVGPVPDSDKFIENYASYAKNSQAHIPIAGDYHDGLFINIAHGSRGFSTAPVSAALIRSCLLEQPYIMPFSMATALHPARFLVRDIVRKKYL